MPYTVDEFLKRDNARFDEPDSRLEERHAVPCAYLSPEQLKTLREAAAMSLAVESDRLATFVPAGCEEREEEEDAERFDGLS